MSLRLVPDELWALAEPLIPKFKARPQGGGTAPVDDRAVFTAIVYVLTIGCPAEFAAGVRMSKAPCTAGSWPGPRPGCGGGATRRC